MSENKIEKYLEGEYDGQSVGETLAQASSDIAEAVLISQEVRNYQEDVKESETKRILRKDKVSEEEIEGIMNDYATNEEYKQYLMNGAILQCDQASLEPFPLPDGAEIDLVMDEGEDVEKRKNTELIVTDDLMLVGDTPYATVLDAKQGENIFPFKCHCKKGVDRETEYLKIKNDPSCKMEGVCKHLMKLNREWDNLPLTGQFYKTRDATIHVMEDLDLIMEDTQCITMTSMLFCKHGGLITPVSSGQIMVSQFVGYLAYGCNSITQNPEEGYYMLYDGPTVDSIGEEHSFSDIYSNSSEYLTGALQGYGGDVGLNTEAGTKYEGAEDFSPRNGVLPHNDIMRHAIALGPTLQNPNFTLSSTGGIKADEMIYGACVDVTIEFEGKTYYIPAVIVDSKEHSAPNGLYQTNETFAGIKEGDSPSGNIVEWYVYQGDGDKNKSTGLNKFTKDGGIIIYKDERAVEKDDESY